MQWTDELEEKACTVYENHCFANKVFKERGADYPLAWIALDERYREAFRDHIREQLKTHHPKPLPEQAVQLFPTATLAILGVRDACHQAAMVVTCECPVWPGDSLVFAALEQHQTRRVRPGEARHGLVDPWRQEKIPAGEPFWFHLAPEVIRSPLWHQFRLTLEAAQKPIVAVPPEPKLLTPTPAAPLPLAQPLKGPVLHSMTSGVLPRPVATMPPVLPTDSVGTVSRPSSTVATPVTRSDEKEESDDDDGLGCHRTC